MLCSPLADVTVWEAVGIGGAGAVITAIFGGLARLWWVRGVTTTRIIEVKGHDNRETIKVARAVEKDGTEQVAAQYRKMIGTLMRRVRTLESNLLTTDKRIAEVHSFYAGRIEQIETRHRDDIKQRDEEHQRCQERISLLESNLKELILDRGSTEGLDVEGTGQSTLLPPDGTRHN